MCGIAGVASFGPRALPPSEVVDAMCRTIAHRGPDAQGEFRGSQVHLGMRRLAIIDLAGGQQPVPNEDGSIQLVFNGEIYNYRALRGELEAAGHRFRTDSDTESIVHAYEQWGVEAFAHLRGMFAIALVDLRQARLVLARDRFGKKPLYYTTLPDGTFAFGSELKCLAAVPGFAPTVSGRATRDFFALGYVPGPQTIYEDVHKLPPAHWLQLDARALRTGRYWQIAAQPPRLDGDEDSLKDALRAQLEDAVRVRLVSDVPFGAFLSGGLDSSVVAALMARNLGEPVKTFTIGFREDAFNEIPDARAVARHIGSDHHELVVDADAVRLLHDLVWHFDEPFGDSSAIPTYLVSKLAAGHVKMVLSGDGGDELFSGYDRYRRFERLEAMRRSSAGLAAAAARGAAALLRGERGRRLGRIADRLSMPFPDSYLSGVALSTAGDLRALLRPEVAAADPYESVRAHFDAAACGDPMEAVLRGDMATYLCDDILVKVDRMTMAHSLEARAPLLDHQLAEFVARLPMSMKVRGGRGKHLLRRVAADLLPAALLDKRKQGFAIPVARWLRHELRELVEDTLRGDRAWRERGIFNPQGVERLVREHLDGAHDHAEHLWLLLTYEMWARRFPTRRTPQAPALAA